MFITRLDILFGMTFMVLSTEHPFIQEAAKTDPSLREFCDMVASQSREGWPGESPFDAILLSCAADHIPPLLWEQLAEGGRLILPLGTPFGYQELELVTKERGEPQYRSLGAVVFVPLR